MERYAAFLRGMNLGGRRITNQKLAACFEAMGLAEVAPFLASGNVTFAVDAGDAGALARRLEEGLREALGYEVPIFLRTADELTAIAAQRPFAGDEGSGRGKPQVAFLHAAPPAAAQRRVLALATPDDRLAFGRRELHWLPSAGVGGSTLDWRAVEKTLGPTTVRTRRTVERLVARLP